MSLRSITQSALTILAAGLSTAATAGAVYLSALSATPTQIDEGDTVVLRAAAGINPTYANDHFYNGTALFMAGDGRGAKRTLGMVTSTKLTSPMNAADPTRNVPTWRSVRRRRLPSFQPIFGSATASPSPVT